MADPCSCGDAAEAELVAAIKERREAERSRAEDLFIHAILILPFAAFLIAAAQALL